MYDPAQHFTYFETGQVVNIPSTNPAITIVLNWQRCYRSEQKNNKSLGYVGWFSYGNIRLRSIASSTHVVIANATDSVSESPAEEQKQFNLEPLFNELNTVVGKELEILSLLCFDQKDKNSNSWILKRRYREINDNRLYDVARYGGHTITADLEQMLVLYHHSTGDTSLWI